MLDSEDEQVYTQRGLHFKVFKIYYKTSKTSLPLTISRFRLEHTKKINYTNEGYGYRNDTYVYVGIGIYKRTSEN